MRRLLVLTLVTLVGCGQSFEREDAGEREDASEDSGPASTCAPGGCDDAGAEPGCRSDADCDVGVCDLSTDRCTTGCRRGDRISIDIPAQRVEVTLAVNGAPIPDGEEGALLFWREDALDAGSALPLAELGAGRSATVTLAPGRHVAVIVRDEATELVPRGFVGYVDVTPDLTRLALDVPLLEHEITITVDGAPTPRFGGRRHLVLSPVEVAIGLSHRLYIDGDTEGTVRMHAVPGTYRVASSGLGGAPFPLGSPLPFTEVTLDGSATIDIPTTHAVFDVTLGGAPPPPELTLALAASPGVYASSLTEVSHDAGRVEVTLLEGSTVQIGVPGSVGCFAATTVSGREARQALNLDCVVRELAVGLDPPAGCRARIRWGEEPWLHGSHLGEPPEAVWVGPQRHLTGTLEVFDSCARGAALMGHGAVVGPFDVSTDRLHELTIPVREATLHAVFGGTRQPAPRGWPVPAWLVGDGTGLGALQPLDQRMIYFADRPWTVHYLGTPGYAGWPATPGVVHVGPLATADIEIELPRRLVHVEVTLGGRPFPPWDPSDPPWEAGNWPSHVNVRAGSPAHPEASSWGLYEEDGSSPYPTERWVLPGEYHLQFDHFGSWPINAAGPLPPAGIDLGCWIVE